MKNTNTHFANRSAKTVWMRVSLSATMFALSALLAGAANAGVDVTQITRGDVSFSQDGNRLIVRCSNGSIIEYSRFSIEAGQIMQFIQPSSTSTVLNRVTGAELSRIDGTLLSNGIVYLVNPQGFRIGNGALINVGGFYAAAGAMSDNDFVQGRDNFTNLSGKVINEGAIQAKSVALVGQYVANRGTINVDNGMVAMAAGDTVYLQNGSGPIMVTVSRSQMGADGSGAGMQAAVSNTGTINAGSGSVAMASGDFYALAMDLSGTIIGKSIAARGGAGGVVAVNGTLDASSTTGKGGDIDVFGDRVGLFGNALVNANGATGGGSVRIGGDYLGTNAANAPQANRTVMGTDARITANATQSGDGGRVIMWSNEYTGFFGAIQANGAGTGNGGFVETSSHDNLQAFGSVSASSVLGKAGTWLLDPSDIFIENSPTSGGAFSDTNPNIFTPTADSAVVDVNVINASLTAGTSVIIDTVGVGTTQTGTILLQSDILMTNAVSTSATLTLNAADSITLNSNITASINNNLSVVLNAVNGVTMNGNITTQGGSLTIANSGASAVTQSGTSTLVIGGTTSVTTGGAAIGLVGTGNNDFTGAVSLTNTGGVAISITDRNALVLGTVSISGLTNLVVNSVGLTQDGSTTITTGGATQINAGAGEIRLTNANVFNGSVRLTNTDANNIAITTTGNLLLNSVSMSAVDAGTLTINSVGLVQGLLTSITTGTGAVTINSGAGVLQLTSITNDFNGAVSLTNTGAFAVSITDTNALVLGTSSTSDNLSVITGSGGVTGGLTQTGALTVDGTTTITSSAALTNIDLSTQANNFAGTFTLGTPGNVQDFKLLNTNAAAGAIVDLTNAGTTGLRDLTINYTNAAYEVPTLTMSTLRNIAITAGGAITQGAGGINNSIAAGTASFSTGNFAITLTQAANDFGGAVSLTNTGVNSVAITDTTALVLGTVSMTAAAAGTLAITSVGLTQDGVTTITTGTGAVTINGGAGVITLTNNNDFNGAVSLTNTGANAVAITDANALVMGTVSMSAVDAGTLAITSVGLTQDGVTTITTGTGAVTINGGAGVITLTNNNDFNGAVSLTNTGANAVAITDATALVLGTVSMTAVDAGTLAITSVGLTQDGATTITTGTGAVTINGGAGVITLTNNNDFNGAVSLTNTGVNAVAITDTNALVLGTVSMTAAAAGTLAITSVGLTQDGVTTITTGTGAVTINGGAGVITLTNANTFNGILSLANSGVNNDVSITDINRLRLGASSIGRDLNIITTNNISVESAITVGRDISISAVPIGGGPAINVEVGVENVSLFSITNDDFANMTAGGNLNITATGFMTVDGVLLGGTIGGITTLTAGGTGVTFSGASSNFNNALTVASIATIAGVNITAGNITTAGNMTFANTVTLTTGAVSLNSNGGAILFSNTLTGGNQNLTIAAGTGVGTTTFTGVVSGMGAAATGAAITLASTGLVDFQNTVGGASGIVSTNSAGSTRFQQDVTLTNGDTASTFAGAVTFDGMNWSGFDGLTVSGATTLTSGAVSLVSNGAGINFGGIITDGASTLDLALDAGATGAIAATGVNAAGLIDINNLTITNAASATFAGNVQVNDLITTVNLYTVTMTGATNTFAQNVAFLNSGRVTMGDVAGTDTFLFTGGMNFTNNAPSSIGGIIRSPGQVLDFGTGGLLGVTLLSSSTVDSTNAGGVTAGAGINFGGIIDGAISPSVSVSGLIVNAGIADVTFNDVGTNIALANLTVTSGALTTHFLGNVTTVGDQIYNGGAQMDANIAFTATDTNGDITFNGAVRSGIGLGFENMTVLAGGNVTFNDTVGGTDTTTQLGNFTVDCGNDLGETITFGTAAATVRADAVNLNTNTLLATPATIATIVARSNISFANTTFAMGQNEKLTSLGGIRINGLTGLTSNATSVTLGDVNAVGNLRVTSPSITLLARASGPITTNTGGTITDSMVTYIVGGQVFFSTTPVMSGSGTQATFSNPTGNVDGSGTLGNFAKSVFQGPITVALLTGTTGQILDLSTSGSVGFGNPALIIPQPMPLLPPVGLLGNSDTLDQDSADDSTNGNSKKTSKPKNSKAKKAASDKPAVSAVVPVASR